VTQQKTTPQSIAAFHSALSRAAYMALNVRITTEKLMATILNNLTEILLPHCP